MPRFVAVVGISACRRAFDRPKTRVGEQAERLVTAWLWVLLDQSGLDAP